MNETKPMLSVTRRAETLAIERGSSVELRPRSFWGMAGGVVLALTFGLFAWGEFVGGRGTGYGLLLGPIFLLAIAPVLRSASRTETSFDLRGILFCSFSVKLFMIFGRYFMVNDVYSGVGDSSVYHVYGVRFAPVFRTLRFDVDPGLPIPGTGWIRVLTGLVYAVVGSDRFGGFMVFGMLAWIGTVLLYKAFVLAMPNGNRHRYAVLVLFAPTVGFWPSAIGKEAWMLLGIGLASYGAARVLSHLRGGITLVVLGIGVAFLPRPHIAVLLLAAFLVALVMSSIFQSDDGVRSFGFVRKFAAIVLLTVVSSLLAPQLASFLQIDDVGGSGFTQTLDRTNDRTNQGGSSFDAPTVETPFDYPVAFVTVLFRPFPWEANNLQMLLTAFEGLFYAVVTVVSIRRLSRLPAELLKKAYVAYAAVFCFMFVYVFAFIGNFGILARQRSQMLPLFFVLLCLPTRAQSNRAADDDHSASDAEPARPKMMKTVSYGLAAPRR